MGTHYFPCRAVDILAFSISLYSRFALTSYFKIKIKTYLLLRHHTPIPDPNNLPPPAKTRFNKISGSLCAAVKPRIRRMLEKMSTIREACGTATIVCGLLMPRYVTERCYSDKLQLDNVQEEEIGEVHEAVRSYSKSCLLAASPSWTLSWPSWGRRMRQS